MQAKHHFEDAIRAAIGLAVLVSPNPEQRRLVGAILEGIASGAGALSRSNDEMRIVAENARLARIGLDPVQPADTTKAGDNDEFVEVVWRDSNIDGPEQRTRLSRGLVEMATFDGSAEGRSAAASLVRVIDEGSAPGRIYPVDEQAFITIVSPKEWAGSYSVSRSVTERKGKEVRGYMAYEVDLSPMEPEHLASHIDALRRMTPADQVFHTFSILSNPYGDLVGLLGPDETLADEQKSQIGELVDLYDNGTLHDRGRIVLDRLTNGIGVNIERHLDPDEDYPLVQELENFHGKTGYRAQPCDWKLGTGFAPKAIVVFVPHERIADAADLHDLLWSMEVPKGAPTP